MLRFGLRHASKEILFSFESQSKHFWRRGASLLLRGQYLNSIPYSTHSLSHSSTKCNFKHSKMHFFLLHHTETLLQIFLFASDYQKSKILFHDAFVSRDGKLTFPGHSMIHFIGSWMNHLQKSVHQNELKCQCQQCSKNSLKSLLQ